MICVQLVIHAQMVVTRQPSSDQHIEAQEPVQVGTVSWYTLTQCLQRRSRAQKLFRLSGSGEFRLDWFRVAMGNWQCENVWYFATHPATAVVCVIA